MAEGSSRARVALKLLAGLLGAVSLLVVAGVALAAASFSDPPGDNNAAPDVTAVAVSETPDGNLTIAATLANYQALPANSWVNLWFDLDSNPRTGDDGDEALVQYFDDGGLQFFRWNGTTLVRREATGMTASVAAGVLTFTGPKAALDGAASFNLLTVASRGHDVGDDEDLIASDSAHAAADLAVLLREHVVAHGRQAEFVPPAAVELEVEALRHRGDQRAARRVQV